MSVLQTIIKVIAASGLLYAYYYCFLRNRFFHRYNRFFLLIAVVAAVASPFLSIPFHLRPAGGQETSLTRTLQVIAGDSWHEAEGSGAGISGRAKQWGGPDPIVLLYLAGLALSIVFFMRSLLYIRRIRRKYAGRPINDIRFYETTEAAAPFSFFRHVFWRDDIPFDSKQGQQIFRHELCHVRERHSLDILLMELLCCAGWFNPFFHLIRKELRVLHEFLADEHIAGEHDRLDYAELLVVQALQDKNAPLAHSFAHHPIKRRIMMLTSHPSLHRKSGYVSRALVLPLLLLLLGAFALRPVRYAGTPVHAAPQPVSVVIDAGHGGIDPGAVVDNIAEKDIALSLALKIKELAPQYNVNVVMTREKDELPGSTTDIHDGLRKRTEITAQVNPVMFISLHVNLGDSGDTHKDAGFEAYVAGRKEDKKAEALAGTLLQQLSGVYTVTPGIRKRTSKGIWVLDHNPVTAVLLECGNLRIPADRDFITDPKNQEKVARTILQGIVQYEENGKPGSR